MGKHDKLESYGTEGRGDRKSSDPNAWNSPRDVSMGDTPHDNTRLTEHERYGVTYGDGSK